MKIISFVTPFSNVRYSSQRLVVHCISCIVIERHQSDVIEKMFTSVQKGKVFKPFGFNLLCLLPFLRSRLAGWMV